VLGGKQVKLQVAHTKLSHSRAYIVRAYLLQTHEMLFDALTQAFRVLGGVPQRGICSATNWMRIRVASRRNVPERQCGKVVVFILIVADGFEDLGGGVGGGAPGTGAPGLCGAPPVTFDVHLEDGGVVHEPVHGGKRHGGIANHLGLPLTSMG